MVWSRFPLIVYCFSNPFQRKFSCARIKKLFCISPGTTHQQQFHQQSHIFQILTHNSVFIVVSMLLVLENIMVFVVVINTTGTFEAETSWGSSFVVEMATLSFGLTHFGESRTKRKLPELQSCFHFHNVSHSVMVWEVSEGDIQAVSKQCNVWNLNFKYRANDT